MQVIVGEFMVYEKYASTVNISITDMEHKLFHYLVAERAIDAYFAIPVNTTEGKVLHFSLSLVDKDIVPQRAVFGSFALPPPAHIEYDGTSYKLIVRNETDAGHVASVKLCLVDAFEVSTLSWSNRPNVIADLKTLNITSDMTPGTSEWAIDVTEHVTGVPPVDPPIELPIEPPVEPPIVSPPVKKSSMILPIVLGAGALYVITRRK